MIGHVVHEAENRQLAAKFTKEVYPREGERGERRGERGRGGGRGVGGGPGGRGGARGRGVRRGAGAGTGEAMRVLPEVYRCTCT